MTRTFLFASLFATVALFAGAIVAHRSVLAAVFTIPAVALHVTVVLAFFRATRPRTRAYFLVIRRPAILSITLFAVAPLSFSVGMWLFLPLTWVALLTSLAAFHVEYQSIRESEHARSIL